MRLINNILESFSRPFMHSWNVKWLRIGVLAFLVFNAMELLSVPELAFGTQKASPSLHQSGWLTASFYLLEDQKSTLLGWVFLILSVITCLGAILTSWKRTFGLLCFFVTSNFFNGTYMLNSGGHQLIQLFLFYLIFMNEEDESEVGTFLNQLGFKAIRLQLVMMYLISALYKIVGESWLSGNAVWQTLQIDQYSLPILQDTFGENTVFLMMITYLVLTYQLLFPVVIWFASWRKSILIIGLLIHLFIGVGMGLVSFALAMFVGYMSFWPIPSSELRKPASNVASTDD